MAAVPLNKFRTIRSKLSTNLVGIYTCPIGVSAIVTLCNVTNITTGVAASSYTVTGIHSRGSSGYQFANQEEVPPYDSMNMFPDGRLALETNDVLYFSSNSSNKLDLIISILETAKQ
jgi:hypothetical protein